MNQIIKGRNEFEIRFQYRQFIVNAVKELPGRRYRSDSKCWTVPLSFADKVEAFAKKYRFEFSDSSNPHQEINLPALPPLPELTQTIYLKGDMFPFQKRGVAYGLQKKRLIIGDEPGLGKTLQSISIITGADAFPCLVICPSSLKINWQREWSMWTHKRAVILDEKIAKNWVYYNSVGYRMDVAIVNYESLKKYFVSEMPEKGKNGLKLKDIKFSNFKDVFKSIIIDESHRVKSFAALQTKLTRGIADGKEYRLALTGTPVLNKPSDLCAQLGIIGQLNAITGDHKPYPTFINRYCQGGNGAANLKELNYKLNMNCFYRRAKEEVLTELPAKMRQVILSDISTRREYNDAIRDLEQYLKEYRNASDEQIAKSMRGEIMVRIGVCKNISARGKLREVREFIDDTIEANQKLIVFAHLKAVFDDLMKLYPEAVTIRGQDSMDDRQRAIDKFQNDPEQKLIFCSIKAAGVGLTLTASSRVAFIELPWTAADCDQCEDRAHRIGQQDSVMCTYFLGKDTIDEKIYQIIQDKRDIHNQVVGNTVEIETSIVDNLLNLFNQPKMEEVQ